MPQLFATRSSAGRILGLQLAKRGIGDAIVLGLPRGGVPVAYEVAVALGAPLDVFVVRKLGVPMHDELAMGAIASGGVRVLVREVVDSLQIAPAIIDAVARREQRELDRREREYRGARPFPDLHGRTVIIVDDGVATGATMIAAVRAIHTAGAARIIAAAPVMARQARASILAITDACECVAQPEPFFGVGLYYDDFAQTTDDEVRELLAAAAELHTGTQNDGHLIVPAGGLT